MCKPRVTMIALGLAGLLLLGFGVAVFAQDCEYCEDAPGVNNWQLDGSGNYEAISPYDECEGTYTNSAVLCGGGTETAAANEGSGWEIGWPSPVEMGGDIYVYYGANDTIDNFHMVDSTDSGSSWSSETSVIDNATWCGANYWVTSGNKDTCEMWLPNFTLSNSNSDSNWYIYFTGHQTGSSSDNYEHRWVSTNSGSSWSLDSSWSGLDSSTQYAYGALTGNGQCPGSSCVMYFYALDTSSDMYEFSSTDGESWTNEGEVGTWGIGLKSARYDETNGYYVYTFNPPTTVYACTDAYADEPYVSIASTPDNPMEGIGTTTQFWGPSPHPSEPAPVADGYNQIESGTARLLLYNDGRADGSPVYNGGNNTIYSMPYGDSFAACGE